MVILYYTNFSQPLSPHGFEKYLESLPTQIAVKIRSFKDWKDAHTSLFGKLFLLKGLRAFNLPQSLTDLKYTYYGKPYFDSLPIDFNISHSSSSVVCVVSSEGIIGVDIEEVRSIEIQDFQEQFLEVEWKAILASQDSLTTFFTYWTQKESAIKADGRGLHIPLHKVSIEQNGVYIENQAYLPHDVYLSAHLKCCLATRKTIKDLQIRKIVYY